MNLKDQKFLITGGTGSFGGTVSNYLLENDIGEIRIFSRDENKQDLMRKRINNSRVNFFIGDIRDFSSIKEASQNIDYVFENEDTIYVIDLKTKDKFMVTYDDKLQMAIYKKALQEKSNKLPHLHAYLKPSIYTVLYRDKSLLRAIY